MAGTLKWYSCSTNDFPLKRHKVSKACEVCRGKKMKCDGKFPCQRCANNKTTCKYNHDKKSTSTTTQQQQKESFPFIPVKKLHKIPFYYYCNSLPPLLLDFFNNLQQQKSSVWTQFFKLYNQEEEREDRIEDINSVLLKEAFRLFVTHNLLYGAFFIQNRQYETTNRMIIYCILALTFYSAYQISLSDQKQDLYLYSIQFYKKAHKLFFEACFPTAVNHAKQIDKIQLIQASILLAHFQCQVFDKEQSFMMIRIGLDLVDYIVEEDKDQCTIKVLDAWYYWLLFYLEKRKTVTIEDEQPMISLPTTLKNPSHIWAFNVIDAYTFFLKSILIKNKHESMNIKSIKESLGQLLELSSTKNTYNNQVIYLYNQILTIQIFQCINVDDDSHILDLSIKAAQNILSTIKKIFKEELIITRHSIHLLSQFLSLFNSNESIHDLQAEFIQFLKSQLVSCKNNDMLTFFKSIYYQFTTTPTPITTTTTTEEEGVQQTIMITSIPSSPSSSDLSSTPIIQQHDLNPTSPSSSHDLFTSSLPIKPSNNSNMTLLEQQNMIVKSRGNMDQEQLDKLSRKLPSSSSFLRQQQQMNDSSNYVFSTKNEDVIQQQHYYNINKRSSEQQLTLQQNHKKDLLEQRSRHHYLSNHHEFINIHLPPPSSDDLMYWVLDEEPPFYNNTHSSHRRPHSHSSSTTTSSSSDALFLLANNNVLPLPQPSKISGSCYNTMLKHDPHTWSKFFFASEVQTLHYQQQQQQQQASILSNNTLDVIQEEEEIESTVHTSGQTESSSSTTTTTTATASAAAAAAAAAAATAAAIWASTVVALNPQQQGHYSFPTNNKERKRKRDVAGHWINSEKVLNTTTTTTQDEEEYW